MPGLNFGKNGIMGTNDDDILFGTSAGDMIVGGDGKDSLWGYGGDDWLFGGEGNDTLQGGSGADWLVGGQGNDTLYGGTGADTLDGGTGTDLAIYSSSTTAVQVDLLAGTATGGDAAGDTFISVENLQGSGFGDTLSGNNLNNHLHGSGGIDVLTGNGGADTFSFWAGSSMTTGLGGSADRILDFDRAEGDKIQIVDTFSGDIPNPWDFHFIGKGNFTGAEGEVRFSHIGGETWISGDVNGDAAADFQIRCSGLINFIASDFVL